MDANRLLHGDSNYRNQRSKHEIIFHITVRDEGQYLSFTAPDLYTLVAENHLPALARAILWINSTTPLIRYQCDANDGEVTAVVELPVSDAGLGSEQLEICYLALVRNIDRFDTTLSAAISHGVVV